MFSDWILEIHQKIDGRSMAAQFGADEKNVRNLLTGKVKNTRQDPVNLAVSYFEALPEGFLDIPKQVARALASDLIQAAKDSIGPLNSFFLAQDREMLTYPETIKLATLIDKISDDLFRLYRPDDLTGLKDYLLSLDELDDDYWQCPSTNRDMRLEWSKAETWDDMQLVLGRIRYNIILSVVAIWDIEYVSARFDRIQPIPLLLALAPQVKPALTIKPTNLTGGAEIEIPHGYRGFRDVVDTPMSLFIDLLACLVHRSSKCDWPERLPKVSQMMEIFSGIEYQNLVNIRAGLENLTIYKIDEMLVSSDVGVGDIFPLIAAAHIWEKFLVPETAGGEHKVLIPDDDYLRFWSRHRERLANQGRNIEGGQEAWPAYLARRSARQDRLGGEQEKLY